MGLSLSTLFVRGSDAEPLVADFVAAELSQSLFTLAQGAVSEDSFVSFLVEHRILDNSHVISSFPFLYNHYSTDF